VTNSVGSITSTPALLVTVAPLITTQPTNVTVIQGQSANFAVSVTGLTPFRYQWLLNGTSIANATNRIYALSHATNSTDAGDYQVIVGNPLGVQTSSVATLTVVVPPAITVQPVSVIALAGQTVNFSVGATGTPLFYQWHFNSTNLPAANSATLTLANVTTNNTGTYFVTVTNLGGTVNSTNVSLTVYTSAVPVMAVLTYTNHQATVTLAGIPTFNYSVEASSNLVDWVILGTNASPFTVIDTNRFDYQFYRGHYLP
ncbi:MAG TPA: immunoglobulin domain-containing protein, partial [Candidatus Acidoferrales bacterium]|nr:immunoglobulin domain-containing protein [Candidatus Acidoferrales bacterium]